MEGGYCTFRRYVTTIGSSSLPRLPFVARALKSLRMLNRRFIVPARLPSAGTRDQGPLSITLGLSANGQGDRRQNLLMQPSLALVRAGKPPAAAVHLHLHGAEHGEAGQAVPFHPEPIASHDSERLSAALSEARACARAGRQHGSRAPRVGIFETASTRQRCSARAASTAAASTRWSPKSSPMFPPRRLRGCFRSGLAE